MTSPGAHGEGEAVTLWRWPHNQREFFAPIPDAKQPHLGNAKMPMGCVVYTALPAAEFDALLARANTAKVAADLMRARAERAEAALAESAGAAACHALEAVGIRPDSADDFDEIVENATRAALSRLDDALGEG